MQGRSGRAPWARDHRNDAPEVGDEIEGGYTREQLRTMNEKFAERMTRALANERRLTRRREATGARARVGRCLTKAGPD